MVHTWFVKTNFTWLPLLYVPVCVRRPLTIYFVQEFIWKMNVLFFQEHRPFSIHCRRLQAEIKALQQIRTRHQSYPPIVLPTHRKPACCVIVGWQEDKWGRGTEWRKKVGLGKQKKKPFCYLQPNPERFRLLLCKWTRAVRTVRCILEQEGAKDDGENSSRDNSGESAKNWLMSDLLHWLL